MKKEITAEQSLELAARMRKFDTVPEFSLIFGDPADSEPDFDETVAFARQVKRINPEVEIVVQTYCPVPNAAAKCTDVWAISIFQPRRMSGPPIDGSTSRCGKIRS